MHKLKWIYIQGESGLEFLLMYKDHKDHWRPVPMQLATPAYFQEQVKLRDETNIDQPLSFKGNKS